MTYLHHPILLILFVLAVLMGVARSRYDVVAVFTLLVAVLSGVLNPRQAVSGFSHPIVVIVALLAVIGVAIRNSGVIETVVGGLTPVLRWESARVVILGGISAGIAALIGSGPVLAVLPTGLQGLRRDWRNRRLLLPIALLAALGGLVSLVGTLPNLLVAVLWPRERETLLFDFAMTGLPVLLAALLVVAVAWRFLPRDTAEGIRTPGSALAQVEAYISEVLVPRGSPLVGQTVGLIEQNNGGSIRLKSIVRESFRRIEPRADWAIEADDVLVLACEPTVLQRLMEQAGLRIVGGAAGDLDPERIGVVEAIIAPGSELVGRSPDEGGFRRRQVSLLAIGRSGRQPSGRLHRTKLQAGDVLVLQGELASMPATLAGMGCLILTERRLRLGRRRQVLIPLLVLLAALFLAVSQAVPLSIALLAAVLVLVLIRSVTLDELYAAVPWPTLVLLGAILPIGFAFRDGGDAVFLAGWVAPVLRHVPDAALVLGTLVLSLAAAPFLTGVVTVVILAPFAAALAMTLGLRPDPFLVATALGASCEFVAPGGARAAQRMGRYIGHGAETWRLTLLLSAVVLVVGGAAVLWTWPSR
ncbi:MAG: SLC13 family permease [Janthinobacterium lividum]